MVDKYDSSVRVISTDENDVETYGGQVEVVLHAEIDVTGYGGEEVTDEDVEKAAMEAIQEGKCRVVTMRPTARRKDEENR